MMQPEEIVMRYYQALCGGNVQEAKEFMTKKSYFMALQSLGIRMSLQNPIFKSLLDKIEEDQDSLKEVEERLSAELLSRNRSPHITIKQIVVNGSWRKIVSYEEDGKAKKLYFSKVNNLWLIDYYAGRPASKNYIAHIKKWIISVFSKTNTS
jgi:hypothetical protein